MVCITTNCEVCVAFYWAVVATLIFLGNASCDFAKADGAHAVRGARDVSVCVN